MNKTVFLVLIAIFVAMNSGCISESENEVVVYCALDKEFSEPILRDFENEIKIRVLPKYDQESNKTVGLANEIIQSSRQRCDVFWNNEILHTLRLKQKGLLEVYQSSRATEYPSQFVSPDSDWHGFAARARVLIVNTELLTNPSEYPRSLRALADPKWKNNCAMARPLFGTTATQAAVLFDKWGPEMATDFFKKVSKNAIIESGNKQVAINVARGRYAFGITDTDDAIIEVEQGQPVALVFPDQEPDGMGTLFIPNTLAIIKGGPNPAQAKKLVDYLLQGSVEVKLSEGSSAQIPLNKTVSKKSRVESEKLKFMEVDFQAAADGWEKVKLSMAEIFPL